jgi:phage repressor protein C with HTH and peptisase S24 domain
VLEANQRLFIKRVTERFDGVHEITSDNPSVKTVQALDGSQQVDILGRVIWTWNGKKI